MKRFLAFLVLTVFTGCGRETRPAGILDPDTFAKVYVDLVDREAMMSKWTLNGIRKFDADSTFSGFGITRDQFERTVSYFNEDLPRWKDFYAAVIALQEAKGKEGTQEGR